MSARTPGVIPFHRPARIFPAPLPTAPLRIVTPPTIPESNQGSLLQVLFPLIGSATLVGFAVISGNRLYLAIAIGIAVLMVGIGIAIRVQMKRQVKKQRRENVQKYRDYLARLRAHLEGVTRTQSETALRLHPDIEGLWSLVNEGRYVWERRPRDPDFMHLRLGLGAVPLAAPLMLELSDDPLVEYEPDLLEGVKDLYEEFKELARAPVIVPAADLGVVAVIGDPELAHRWVASMLCEVVGLHAPDDVKVVGYFKPEETARWGWLKWLPHTRDSVEPVDETRHGVALATDPEDFEVLLSQLVRPRIDHLDRVRAENRPHEEVRFQQAVVLIEEPHATAISELGIYEEMLQRAAEIGVLVLTLVGDPERVPATVGARVELSEGGWLSYTEAGPEGRRASDVRADAAGVNVCEALARTLAPLRLQQRRGRARQVDSEGLFDLLHVSGPAEIAPQRWRRPTRALLRTPLGIAEDGSVTVLDLKESAEDGLGPHGLIVGATGSGKSELLRTLVTGLAIEHSPDDLAMVLVDFKGGATFAELARLPQTAGMITNIERDLTLVDRMHEALFGELERRQRILQEAGNFDRVRDYQKHRRAHPQQGLPPLPSLLVIIDEFGELLAGKPDFIDLFVSMGRLGRSLGVHLLLATQRLEAGRLRGLESHLRYRICLRTFSAEESQAVLGVRDAYELPPLPGLGYLSVDGNLVQFKAALSTRPYRERRELESRRAPGVVRAFTVSRSAPVAIVGGGAGAEVTPEARGAAAEGTGLATELRVAVDRLEELVGVEDRVRQVWLAPLPPALSLDEVVDPDKEEDRSPVDPGWLEVVVGLKDRPRDQLQEPLALRFTGRGGHYAVVGAPRSGKSTLLQGLVGSLALGHDPRDVHVYVVDLGGGLMHALEDAPHVGAVYGRSERAEINRLVRELRAVIDSRVELFRQHRLANMSEFHAKRLSGEIEDEYGEVLLIVDNWALFAQEFEDLQQPLIDMAGTSLHYGVHLVITSNRWLDMRMNLRDNIGGRIELRLNDPLDSEIDRRVAKTLPDLPGRGLSPEAEHFQAALPRIDGRGDVGGLNAAIHALLRVVGERWNESPAAPPIKMLPFELRAGDLPPGIDERHPGILVGLEEFRLEPVWVDLLDRHQHLVVYGDGQCGKTNLLKVVFEGVRGRFGPKEMRVAIVDYRRSLAGAVAGAEHVAAYTYTSDMATQLAGEMMVELRKRMPSAQVGLSAPTMPTAWKGPHVLLLVDDYDLVASPAGNPLGELVEALPQARDIGFHVVLSRRVSGTARGSFEPLYQRLVELGAPGLLMNGDPGEGPILAGEKAQPLPPGRGYLVADRRSTLVQTLLAPEQ